MTAPAEVAFARAEAVMTGTLTGLESPRMARDARGDAKRVPGRFVLRDATIIRGKLPGASAPDARSVDHAGTRDVSAIAADSDALLHLLAQEPEARVTIGARTGPPEWIEKDPADARGAIWLEEGLCGASAAMPLDGYAALARRESAGSRP